MRWRGLARSGPLDRPITRSPAPARPCHPFDEYLGGAPANRCSIVREALEVELAKVSPRGSFSGVAWPKVSFRPVPVPGDVVQCLVPISKRHKGFSESICRRSRRPQHVHSHAEVVPWTCGLSTARPRWRPQSGSVDVRHVDTRVGVPPRHCRSQLVTAGSPAGSSVHVPPRTPARCGAQAALNDHTTWRHHSPFRHPGAVIDESSPGVAG